MAYLFCNKCGHRNPPGSNFCSSCGATTDTVTNQTITLPKVDPLQDAPGPHDDVVVNLNELSAGGTLVVRSGSQAGEKFPLANVLTRLGRGEENEISLDDITVSRRHAEITSVGGGFAVRDLGSLNGTYVNGERIDERVIADGDEVQVGKFRLVFLLGSEQRFG